MEVRSIWDISFCHNKFKKLIFRASFLETSYFISFELRVTLSVIYGERAESIHFIGLFCQHPHLFTFSMIPKRTLMILGSTKHLIENSFQWWFASSMTSIKLLRHLSLSGAGVSQICWESRSLVSSIHPCHVTSRPCECHGKQRQRCLC